MGNKKRNFDISGPKHLKDIVDWNNADHRRSAISSLVQGVYVLESERENSTNAQPWYESFKFQLVEPLKRDDQSIFGAIYKYIGKYPAPDSDVLPRYVIAFRGTVDFKRPNILINDIMLNVKVARNEPEESSCFTLAMDRVKRLVKENGAPNVWLAGHSLGAAIALIVGRNMMLKQNCSLEAYLFNPPYISFPIEKYLGTSMVKDKEKLVRIARGIFKIGLAVAAECQINPQMQEQKADTFCLLSRWTPHLFVNPGDFVCSEYIAYFNDRLETGPQMMKLSKKGCTTVNLLLHFAWGKDLKDAMHLLPSADLTVNQSRPREKTAANDFIKNFKRAHELCQWWHREVRCQSTRYVYSTTEDPGQ
ncbi:GDSL esterase/lipase At4g10955-like [Carya illinoinensis]|uniref:Fungal lipase-type domain-containing protein n=1 Tax=Carya illinoinensis TaxID=32201 RepID=A0A8T1QN76_CARIL|nr:GDSL esterase/lipase At4g10955-like [Carya illinoinensis]KAG6655937.1 hypothetical protein CIPAW_05G251000 [Carya illinoinensis]